MTDTGQDQSSRLHFSAPKPPAPNLPPQAPPAGPARVRRRHFGLMTSFLLMVLLPSVIAVGYLYTRAADQYASYVSFSVVNEDVTSPLEVFGGVTEIGGSAPTDSYILDEFLQSQELVALLDQRLDLRAIYQNAMGDPFFALSDGASLEDLHDYWGWMAQIVHDPGSGLISIRTLAFDPDDANAIATAVLEESTGLIEELSAIAQEDTIAFARDEVTKSIERLKQARETVTRFRSRTQIVDPTADLQGQMGLLNTLEQQLATALIEGDLLRESTREGDIRVQQADRRISVIEARIADERRKLGVGSDGTGSDDYANLLSEFERLSVDREFAEQAYTAALAAFDNAQAEARRKSRYVFAHIKPTLATSSQFPQRELWAVLTSLFLLAGWSICVLIYYSVRDRR